MLTIEQDQIPAEVANVILSSRCCAFIGSGLSINYHSWFKLVNALCDACGLKRQLTADSSTSAFLDAAEEAKAADAGAYFGFLQQHFGRTVDLTPTIYQVLLKLPFDAYLTVNFDPNLASTARFFACTLPIDAYPTLDRKRAGKRSLHHLHGYISEDHNARDGQIVLSRSEFESAYRPNSNLMNFLVPTVENEPMLFVGCRLQEPTMETVFSVCKEHQRKRLELIAQTREPPSQPPPRFIALKVPRVRDVAGSYDPERSRAEQQKGQEYYEHLDITPVWYDSPDNDHSPLLRALQNLAALPAVKPLLGWEAIPYGR